MIRITGTPVLLEGGGQTAMRALLGDCMRELGRQRAGRSDGVTFLSGAMLWDDPQMVLACHQLREIALDTAAMLGRDIFELGIDSAVSFEQWRAWELSHLFLAAQLPYRPEGAEICCRRCLLVMAGSLACVTAYLTIDTFPGENCEAAERYVRSGGELPHKPAHALGTL